MKMKLSDNQEILFLTTGVTLTIYFLSLNTKDSDGIYLMLCPAILFIAILGSQLFNAKFNKSAKILTGLSIFFVGVYEIYEIIPENFIAHLNKLFIVLIFFALRIGESPLLKNKKFIFTNLAPLFLFYREYWTSSHPFSLWVVFTFLNLLALFKPIFKENQDLNSVELHAIEKTSYLFILVLSLLKLSN